MKKVIPIILFIVIFIAGMLYYFLSVKKPIKNHASSPFIVIKGSGDNCYPFELMFKKGTKASEVVFKIYEGDKKIQAIQVKDGREWKNESLDFTFWKNSTIKIVE